jgi:hypothetical protein
MKTRCDLLANFARFNEGDLVWLFRPTLARRKSRKIQPSWEGPYKVIIWINDVAHRIQRHSRAKIMVVHLERLASYLGATRDEQPQRGSSVASIHYRGS